MSEDAGNGRFSRDAEEASRRSAELEAAREAAEQEAARKAIEAEAALKVARLEAKLREAAEREAAKRTEELEEARRVAEEARRVAEEARRVAEEAVRDASRKRAAEEVIQCRTALQSATDEASLKAAEEELARRVAELQERVATAERDAFDAGIRRATAYARARQEAAIAAGRAEERRRKAEAAMEAAIRARSERWTRRIRRTFDVAASIGIVTVAYFGTQRYFGWPDLHRGTDRHAVPIAPADGRDGFASGEQRTRMSMIVPDKSGVAGRKQPERRGNPSPDSKARAHATEPSVLPPAIDPDLFAVDQLADRVLTAVRTYQQEAARYAAGARMCADLRSAYERIDRAWFDYNLKRTTGPGAELDPQRTARHIRLAGEVDGAKRAFAATHCPPLSPSAADLAVLPPAPDARVLALDRLADSLTRAIKTYERQATVYTGGDQACRDMLQALNGVRRASSAYRTDGLDRLTAPLDPKRATRDDELQEELRQAEVSFATTRCPDTSVE